MFLERFANRAPLYPPPRPVTSFRFLQHRSAIFGRGQPTPNVYFRPEYLGNVSVQSAMKTLALLFVFAALLASCASLPPSTDFFQSGIRITPPVRTHFFSTVMADGGTSGGIITDAKGRTLPVFIDHRLGTKTSGAIYLMAYPGRWRSVRVRNEAEFKQKLGWK